MTSHFQQSWQAIPENRKWKYAYCERELRFLLPARPELPEYKPPTHILDKYLNGTNMRLRKADNSGTVEFKMQKKLRLAEGNTNQLWNSTIYISEAEYTLFRPLPGLWLEKQRFHFRGPLGEFISVDEIQLGTESFWIAEVEFKSLAEMTDYAFQPAHIRELSLEPGWSGAELAVKQNLQKP